MGQKEKGFDCLLSLAPVCQTVRESITDVCIICNTNMRIGIKLNTIMRMDKFVTVKEASEKTGVSTDWIRKLCRTNRVESKRFGKSFMVNLESLRQYTKEPHKTGPKPKST